MAHQGFNLIPEGNTESEPLNEAIIWIQATRGSSIKARDVNDPPADPDDYDLYTVGSTPTGDWAEFPPGSFALWFPVAGWRNRNVWDGAGTLYDENTLEHIWYSETAAGWLLVNNNNPAT